ncbi:formate dehydrogenase accessory protein FdhE, partial [Pseudomonas aeruginosa]
MSRTILQPGQIEAAANIPPHLHQPSRDLFARRGERLLQLAEGHPMGDYLRLVAGLCRLQQALLDNPPALAPLDPERLRKSREHGMPPLAYDLLVREGAWLPWLDALLAGYPAPANAAVGAALEQLREADEGQRKAWAIALLSGQFDLLPAALVPFLGAALQVAWSHWLLGL